MKTIPLTCHLFLKDLRHQWAMLAAIWVAAFALPFVFLDIDPVLGTSRHGVLATSGLFLLLVVTLARAIRLDAPVREFHFLATKPVPWRALLAGKFLFALLMLVVPVWVVKLGVIWLMKIPLTPLDVATLLLELALPVGALLAAAAVLTLLVRIIPAALAIMALGAVLVGVADSFIKRNWQITSKLWPFYEPLSGCRFLLFYFVFILAAFAAAGALYGWRSRRVAWGLVAAGIVMGGAVWWSWPYDLSRLFPGDPRVSGPAPEEMRSRITLTLTGKEGEMNNRAQNLGIENGERYSTLSHDLSVKGIAPPYYYTMVDYHGVATLKSGTTIRCAYDDVHAHGMVGNGCMGAAMALSGAQTKDEMKWDVGALEIFNFFPGRYPGEDFHGASVKGTVRLEIRKVVLVKTLPLKEGGTVDFPRRHFVLDRVLVSPHGIDVAISMAGMKSTLRADMGGVESRDMFSMLMFNRARHEIASAVGDGMGSGSSFFFETGDINSTFAQLIDANNGEWREDNDRTFPLDWADGAEIGFFTSVPCGWVELPYEVKGVDLIQR